MIFKIEIANKHLPRVAKVLDYQADILADPVAFKTFVENYIVQIFKNFVLGEVQKEEQAKIDTSTIVTNDDIKPGV